MRAVCGNIRVHRAVPHVMRMVTHRAIRFVVARPHLIPQRSVFFAEARTNEHAALIARLLDLVLPEVRGNFFRGFSAQDQAFHFIGGHAGQLGQHGHRQKQVLVLSTNLHEEHLRNNERLFAVATQQ